MDCCFLCRGPLYNKYLCANCWAELPLRSSGTRSCRRCGIEEPVGDYCSSCAVNEGLLTCNYSVGYYLDTLEELLKLYKLERHLVLGHFFAEILQEVYHREFTEFYLVPVPPRPAKMKKEGWDQIAYLCRILRRKYHLPVLHLLQRRDNRQHKGLGRTSRQSSGDYGLLLAAERRVLKQKSSLRILLLDDVYTTGATIDLCRSALHPLEQAGLICEVRSLTLCLVP